MYSEKKKGGKVCRGKSAVRHQSTRRFAVSPSKEAPHIQGMMYCTFSWLYHNRAARRERRGKVVRLRVDIGCLVVNSDFRRLRSDGRGS